MPPLVVGHLFFSQHGLVFLFVSWPKTPRKWRLHCTTAKNVPPRRETLKKKRKKKSSISIVCCSYWPDQHWQPQRHLWGITDASRGKNCRFQSRSRLAPYLSVLPYHRGGAGGQMPGGYLIGTSAILVGKTHGAIVGAPYPALKCD